MKQHSLIAGLALAGLSLTFAPVALASSHREAPAISNDPAADNTDLYAWVKSGTHDKLYIIANYIPMEEPAGGPNFHYFSDEVLYEIHIARGADSLADVVTYQIRFKRGDVKTVPVGGSKATPEENAIGSGKEFFVQLAGSMSQTYSIRKITATGSEDIVKDAKVAPPRIGPTTQAILYDKKPYDDAFAATFITDMKGGAEGRVFCGPRDDGFYVDLGGAFDLANLRPKGKAQDGVAGYNTHSIALEIPTTLLTVDGKSPGEVPGNATTLGIWASASRQKVTIRRFNGKTTNYGPWVQVSRLGLPLVNEALIGLQDKDKWNATTPATDVAYFGAYFLNPVIVRDAEAVGIYKALGVDPTEFKFDRLDIVDIINLTNIPAAGAHSIPLTATGDVLRVDMAADSGFPNGRAIPGGAKANQEQADVTNVILSLVLAKLKLEVSDGVDYNDKDFLAQFPFLALPWEGYGEGHGKPTP